MLLNQNEEIYACKSIKWLSTVSPIYLSYTMRRDLHLFLHPF